MMVYLASPNTQQQAEHVCDMPVLLSYAIYSPWHDRYQPSFSRLLIDSGAYSAMNSGKEICVDAYYDWSQRWEGHADAIAGLDDIRGDWRKSLKNYERCGFPTIHDTDPPELLDDLIPIARERGGWLGIGLMPPRHNKETWIRETLDRVPDDIHVHGWALRAYTNIRRLDSVDSTNWWRDAMDYNVKLPFLTYGECLEITVKRYKRWKRKIKDLEPGLFITQKDNAS
jgi:hypothetical protein